MIQYAKKLLMILASAAYTMLNAAEFAPPLVIEHGPRDSTKIALTFDACPTAGGTGYDDKVMEILIRENVPATLFISGRWAEKNAARLKRLANIPLFEIANHSFYHPHMTSLSDKRIRRELEMTQNILQGITGKRPLYFRPPFGEVDERLARFAREAGLVTIQYDIASGDADPALSKSAIVRGVLAAAKGGSIIVFHMNGNGLHTAEAIPDIITGLRAKRFELVTVVELLNWNRPALILQSSP